MNVEQLEKSLKALLEEFSIIQRFQRLAEKVKNQTIKDLVERDKQLSEMSPESQELFAQEVNIFTIHNPYTGMVQPYSRKDYSFAQTAKQVHIHQNKQYQWLLVDAYELFEDFLVDVYRLCGANMKEFRIAEDKEFLLSSEVLKRKSSKIISHFRNCLPELKSIEKENKLNKDLRFYLCMIEKFRHIIVHRAGKTSNVDYLIEQILKGSCLFSDKARRQHAEDVIRDHLGVGEVIGTVVLVEKTLMAGGGFTMRIDRHADMINTLLSYALVMSQCISNYVKNVVEPEASNP